MRTSTMAWALVGLLGFAGVLSAQPAVTSSATTSPGDRDTLARVKSALSTLKTLASQMELYRVQHHDAIPPMASMSKWGSFTQKTDEGGTLGTGKFGPYLTNGPMNPFNAKNNVVAKETAKANDGWSYDEVTGQFRLVVTEEQAKEAMAGGIKEEWLEIVK